MAEPTIVCPGCGTEIKLTESLAGPLIEATRRDFEGRLKVKDEEARRREEQMREREEKIRREKEGMAEEVAAKVKAEGVRIAAEEARKAKAQMAGDMETKAKEMAELQAVLKERDEKLRVAQEAQAELMRKQRKLDDDRREMELNIEKQVQGKLEAVRESAKKEAEGSLTLKVMEKQQVIDGMQKQIEELKRKSEQGSQQTQGEMLELQLEGILGGRFPHDRIEAVPKGEHGGDILQRVVSPVGLACGTILWESKRTKNWVDGWLPKLREDQRAAKAEVAIVVSGVLPKGVETFDCVDGVWVTHPKAILPVALCLRQMLMEVSAARQAGEGQQGKAELMYAYLTGQKFKLRVQAIVEAFSNMAEDLHKEKKAIMKQWSKREEQIHNVMQATVGMYGELQGIAGKSLAELEGLDMKMLDEGEE